MKVVMLSVPGTGTRFLDHVMTTVFGMRGVTYNDVRDADKPLQFTHFHTNPYSRFRLPELPGDIRYLAPLRHPIRAWLTRRNRGTSIHKACGWWTTLMEAHQHHDLFLFPVDEPLIDRFKLLLALGHHLDLPVDIACACNTAEQWEPVGSGGETQGHREWARTGKLDGADLAPFDPFVQWYREQLLRVLNEQEQDMGELSV